MQSVIEWESGKTPSVRRWPNVIAFLGYSLTTARTLGERIKAARRRLGITLRELAETSRLVGGDGWLLGG